MITWREAFLSAVKKLGIEVDGCMTDKLALYLDEINTGNRKMNLVSAADDCELAVRHFADSLSCLQFLPEGAIHCVDVGSGAGFPGIPVKIARPEIAMTLVESVGKKADFLSAVVEKLSLKDVDVIRERAEILGQNEAYRERYDIALSRAAAKLTAALEYTLPLVKVGGCAILFQGRVSMEDLNGIKGVFDVLGGSVADVEPYRLECSERALVRVEKTAPTARDYPRRPGLPRKRPLKGGNL